jgi:hypothetical protein
MPRLDTLLALHSVHENSKCAHARNTLTHSLPSAVKRFSVSLPPPTFHSLTFFFKPFSFIMKKTSTGKRVGARELVASVAKEAGVSAGSRLPLEVTGAAVLRALEHHKLAPEDAPHLLLSSIVEGGGGGGGAHHTHTHSSAARGGSAGGRWGALKPNAAVSTNKLVCLLCLLCGGGGAS